MSQLKDELVRLRKEQQRPVQQAESPRDVRKIAATEQPSAESPVRKIEEQSPKGISTDSPLTSLRICYQRWSDDKQTKLQKQKFETDFVGKLVSWNVAVDSVSETNHEKISLYVIDPADPWVARARAEFPATDQDTLLKFRKGDRIVLHGTIKEFFLWPSLKDCRIEA